LAAPQVEREYTAIAHEQDLLINQYGNLRTLGNEAALGEALETGQSGERLTILDPPRVPTSPIGANPLAISFLGMIVAIGLGLGVVPLLEVMDSKIRGQHDVFRILEMPPIGVIPYLETTGDTLKRVTLDVGLGALIIAGAIYVVVTALL
jgi:hypothetical protein